MKNNQGQSDFTGKKLLTEVENAQFIKLLRRHHPNGPLTYKVKNDGRATVMFRPMEIRGGSPAGMCADAI